MRQILTKVDELHNSRYGQSTAVAQVNAFKRMGNARVAREGIDGLVRDVGALDQADPLQFGQRREFDHGPVCELAAASQVEVSDPCAVARELDNRVVGEPDAVAQVEVVEVASELANGQDTVIGYVVALVEHEVANLGCGGNDGSYRTVLDGVAVGQIQYSELVIVIVVVLRCTRERRLHKGRVGDHRALVHTEFSQFSAVSKHGMQCCVRNRAVHQINL